MVVEFFLIKLVCQISVILMSLLNRKLKGKLENSSVLFVEKVSLKRTKGN